VRSQINHFRKDGGVGSDRISLHFLFIQGTISPTIELLRGYGEIMEAQPKEIRRYITLDVVEACASMNKLSESAQQHHEKLDKMLTQSGGAEIYTFVELLDALGFRVEIAPKEN
jgi:DNA-binding phage protein